MARGAHKSPQRTRRSKRKKSQNKSIKLLKHNNEVIAQLSYERKNSLMAN
jgi:hypothetical protein